MQVHQRAAGGAQVALPIDQSMTHEIAAVDVGQRIHPAVDAGIGADGERELRDLQGDLRVVAAVAGGRRGLRRDAQEHRQAHAEALGVRRDLRDFAGDIRMAFALDAEGEPVRHARAGLAEERLDLGKLRQQEP